MHMHAQRAYGKFVHVCLSATRWYCIRPNARIIKFYPPSGHDYFLRPTAVFKKSQGNALNGDVIDGVGKICDFRQKWPFISETVRDKPVPDQDNMGPGALEKLGAPGPS